MRMLTLVVFGVVVAACQSSAPAPSPDPWRGAFVDASHETQRHPEHVEVTALDPVVAQLLRAVVASHEIHRRVAIENLANVDTPGFKRRVVRCSTENVTASNGEIFEMPVVDGIDRVFTTGMLEITERLLDVAIDGEGFFALTLPDGSTGFTRDGCLHLDADGKIVTGNGSVLLPEITVPCDTLEISIDPEGRVSGRTAGTPDTSTMFGQMTLQRFINPSAMLAVGANVLRQTEASGQPIGGTPGLSGLGLLKQGFVERSNVQSSNELMRLQVLERQHESLVRVLDQFGLLAP